MIHHVELVLNQLTPQHKSLKLQLLLLIVSEEHRYSFELEVLLLAGGQICVETVCVIDLDNGNCLLSGRWNVVFGKEGMLPVDQSAESVEHPHLVSCSTSQVFTKLDKSWQIRVLLSEVVDSAVENREELCLNYRQSRWPWAWSLFDVSQIQHKHLFCFHIQKKPLRANPRLQSGDIQVVPHASFPQIARCLNKAVSLF